VDWDNWIPIAVVIVVAISKILGKLKEATARPDEPAPAPPRPRVQRPARPRPTAVTPPVIREAQPRRWTVAADELREFVDRLQRQAQPAPAKPPPVPPPQPRAAPPDEPAPAPKKAPTAKPAIASRANQWAVALRDRQNVRNIIVATEIIGPPKSEQF